MYAIVHNKCLHLSIYCNIILHILHRKTTIAYDWTSILCGCHIILPITRFTGQLLDLPPWRCRNWQPLIATFMHKHFADFCCTWKLLLFTRQLVNSLRTGVAKCNFHHIVCLKVQSTQGNGQNRGRTWIFSKKYIKLLYYML